MFKHKLKLCVVCTIGYTFLYCKEYIISNSAHFFAHTFVYYYIDHVSLIWLLHVASYGLCPCCNTERWSRQHACEGSIRSLLSSLSLVGYGLPKNAKPLFLHLSAKHLQTIRSRVKPWLPVSKCSQTSCCCYFSKSILGCRRVGVYISTMHVNLFRGSDHVETLKIGPHSTVVLQTTMNSWR